MVLAPGGPRTVGRSAGRPADKQTATLETPEIKAISRKNVDFLKPPKSEPVKGKWPKCANAFFYTMIEQTRRYAAQKYRLWTRFSSRMTDWGSASVLLVIRLLPCVR